MSETQMAFSNLEAPGLAAATDILSIGSMHVPVPRSTGYIWPFLSSGGLLMVLKSQQRLVYGPYSNLQERSRIKKDLTCFLVVGREVFLTFSRVIRSPPTWWPRNSILLAPSNHFVGWAVILALLSLSNISLSVLR